MAHSLSPALHRAAYAHLRLAWTYDAYDVTQAALAPFVEGLDPTWRGLSLTMPLKRAALALCDEVSPTVADVGAVNTLLLGPDRRRVGDNTDVPGLVAALRERGVGVPGSAWVLGGGATAGSALVALARLGVREPVVCVRSAARARWLLDLGDRLGMRPRLVGWDRVAVGLAADLVLSTTPTGATRELAAGLVAGAPLHPGAVLLDVAYDPWPTPLTKAWADAGGSVATGLDLLVHQAVEQVRLMTGLEVPVAVLRAAGERALSARHGR